MPQGDEVMSIQAGVVELFFVEGSAGPVASLPLLVQDHPEMILEHSCEGQLLAAQEFPRDGRVKEAAHLELKVAFEPQHIVGGCMEDLLDLRV